MSSKNHELDDWLSQVGDLLRPPLERNVLLTNDPGQVRKALNTTSPKSGQEFQELLSDFRREIQPYLNLNERPEYGAYITGSGTKISAFAEFIKGWYNQNGLKWNNSPITSELEQLVIRWIADFHFLQDHRKGFLTSGGSMSNFMALHLALADRYPEREMEGLGSQKLTVYCSEQTHSSVDRAMVFLGLGRNQLRKVEVNDRYQINVRQLAQMIDEDMKSGYKPLAIIGNAGTTNTGSIDHLDALADVAQRFGVWFHVDGAYGLPAIRLEELKSAFQGLERADSVIVNPHKWMYVTFEVSSVLVKKIPKAIHFSPDYLFTENPGARWESSEHTIELSKEFRALKVWFTLKHFGFDGISTFIEKDIRQINLLAQLLSEVSFIEVEPEHPLSILCFRICAPQYNETENEQMNIMAIRQLESEGKIFITGTKLKNKTYIRVYYGNPERTEEDVRRMADEIVTVCENLVHGS